MDFPRLEVFRAVARRRSFSRAADELQISQPAVSKHIRQLEAEFGVQLFLRLGNRVELTDAGRLLADYAQRVSVLTEDLRRVIGELRGLERGSLRIGASTTPGLYVLPEILARFQSQHPAVEATLAITNSADICRRVLQGEIDLGFVGAPSEAPGLQVRSFAEDEIVLVVPAGLAAARQPVSAPDWLAQQTLITREAGSGTRQIVEARLAALGLAPKRLVELSGCEAVKRAVGAGLGVAFVSRRAVALEIASGLVAVAEIPGLEIARHLVLVARKDARPSAAALAFMALVMKQQPGS